MMFGNITQKEHFVIWQCSFSQNRALLRYLNINQCNGPYKVSLEGNTFKSKLNSWISKFIDKECVKKQFNFF